MGKISKVCDELTKAGADVKARFSELSLEQLNWKPRAKSWSVAQCLDHLIVTHSLMFPILDKLAEGKFKPSFWTKYSPLSGFFGRFLIKGLDPSNLKPMKTTSKAYPSASEIDADIIDRFVEHQKQMIEHVKSLPGGMDAARTIITSPLLGFVTYSMDDWFTILTNHCQRHLNQAVRVTEAEGFPRWAK